VLGSTLQVNREQISGYIRHSETSDVFQMTLWVIQVISGAGSDFRFTPECDRTATWPVQADVATCAEAKVAHGALTKKRAPEMQALIDDDRVKRLD